MEYIVYRMYTCCPGEWVGERCLLAHLARTPWERLIDCPFRTAKFNLSAISWCSCGLPIHAHARCPPYHWVVRNPPLRPYPLRAAIVGPLFGVCLGTHVKNCTTAQALGFPITFAACPTPPACLPPLLCVVMCDCMPQCVCVCVCIGVCMWCLRYHLSLTRPSP